MKSSFHPFLIGVSAAALSCVPFASHAAVATGTELKPNTGLPAFEYMEAPDRLPNYTPGARWGTQAEPITTMQKPLTPDASQRHLVTLPGFETSLFAAEPDIVKPLWLAFDERGRLWIAESVDYPNSMQSPGEGRDRLKIIEDINGDGKADKFTVFADKLSIPTGFVFANGGVVVVHSGKTEFFKDTNGDDKADERRVLFDGWGTRDTHATVSNLRYGFDNWIWGVVGYSGFNGTVGGKELRFGQGIFRFKPDGSELEFVRSSNNNTWGLDFTEDNIVIGSTANGNASMYMPIPNRYYEAVNGWSAARLESIADSQRIFPITEKVRQVDWHGQYTAGSGSAIYTARSFPREYWNRAQFVAEPTGHLLGLFFLDRNGADFVAHNAQSLLASDDEWTAPIYAEVGPDGALWMVDWYNYIIQHNPVPIGFENGRGNAYDTPLRDKVHGRIYRVTHRDGRPSTSPKLDSTNPDSRVAALKNDNKLWRMHAQRLLVERGNKDVAPQLAALVGDHSVDELGSNPAAIHALWTLQGLGAREVLVAAATKAASHPSAAVRRAALMTLPDSSASVQASLNLINDPDAQVRLAAMLALADAEPAAKAGSAIFAALQSSENQNDRWLLDGIAAAAARNDAGFLAAVLTSDQPLTGKTSEVIQRVTLHYAMRNPSESIVDTLLALAKASPTAATAILDGLANGWPNGESPELSSADEKALVGLMKSLPEDTRDRLLGLAQRWGRPEVLGADVQAIVANLRNQVTDDSLSETDRISAAERWVRVGDSTTTSETVVGQINLLTPPTLASGFVSALGESRSAETADAITERWPEFTPAVRRAATGVLLRRPEWAMALLNSVQEEKIRTGEIAPEFWSQLRRYSDRNVARRANRLAAAPPVTSADRKEIVDKLLPLAKQSGDTVRGKEVFEASCMVCHKFNGTGGNVGPELTGISSRDRSEILLEILDPNRSVEDNYRLWTANTKDGESYSGRLEAETRTTVEILDVTGQKHVVQRSDIESLTVSPFSIMPTGFEAFSADDLKGLIEYLATPH